MQTDGQADISNSDTPPSSANKLEDGEIDHVALRAEVVKWQERVPKLAQALRERTEELAATREELRLAKAQDSGGHGKPVEVDDARLQARNDLISELQAKVAELGEKHRRAAGELHAATLDVESAREEAAQWQTKWREVTASLDDSVVNASRSDSALAQAKQAWQSEAQALKEAHAETLEKLQRDNESLRVRNGNLSETIEFANKQIAALGEDMALLVAQAKEAESTQAANQADLEDAIRNQAQANQTIASLESQLADRQGSLDDAQASLQAARQEYEQKLTEATQLSEKLAEVQANAQEQISAIEHSNSEQILSLKSKLEEEDQRYRDAMTAALSEQTQLTDLLDSKDEKLQALDQQLNELQEMAEEHEAARSKFNSAQQKIQQLEEELAKQTDNLVEMRKQVADQADVVAQSAGDAQRIQTQDETIAQLQSAGEALKAQLHQAETQAAENSNELETLRKEQNRWGDIEKDLLEQVNQVAEAGRLKQLELDGEIERLNSCVGQAQDSNDQRESERRELAAKVEKLANENAKLKTNLEERSALVRELEAEQSQRAQARSENDLQHEDLARQLKEAQHRVETFTEHAESLETKLATQQDLMSELEEELSEAQVSSGSEIKQLEQQLREVNSGNQAKAEQLEQALANLEELRKRNYVLQAEIDDAKATQAQVTEGADSVHQVRELEQLLRERTEELDKLRWRKEQPQGEADDNMLMILNQQLNDVRDENTRLRGKLQKVSEEQRAQEAALNEDLTQLKGIGDKVAQQLNEAGINTLEDIVALNESEMQNEAHPLHGFHARMVRDDWVAQAASVLGDQGS